MTQSRRLVTVGIALDASIQRLYEEMSLSAAREFSPDELFIELDATAADTVYVGWGDTDGTKPDTLTSANGLPLVAGQQRVIAGPKEYPRADFRHLCFKGAAGDNTKIVFISYWEVVSATTPV